jgi:hypothetical protein
MRFLTIFFLCAGLALPSFAEENDFARTRADLEEHRVDLILTAKALLERPEAASEYLPKLDEIEQELNSSISRLRNGRLSRVWTTRANHLKTDELPWACLTWWASQIRATAMDFKRAAVAYAENRDAVYLENTGKNLRTLEPGSVYLPECGGPQP